MNDMHCILIRSLISDLQVESRLERREGEAAREREVAHAREKLVR